MITTFERGKLGSSPEPIRPSVISIGVFDGVHLGHRAILRRNVESARELDAVATVITFRRHPKRLILGQAPSTLTTLEHRLELFARAGIQHTVALPFDEALRSLSPREFAQKICVEELGLQRFVLGFDSKFGRDREGSAELLREFGFDVEVVEKVKVDNRAVSSTAIREAVSLGDLRGASRMLGRPVSVLGRVVHGQNLGARIGFPTANLDLHHELHPPPGVYACRARLPHLSPAPDAPALLEGVTNIGFRPTVSEELPDLPLVEVHLFDFDSDLYGEPMELEFIARLRGEKKFDGLEALKAQIARDVTQAKETLAADSHRADPPPAGG